MPAPNTAPAFVPAVIGESSRRDRNNGGKQLVRRRRGSQVSGIIEVEMDGVTVRVGCGAGCEDGCGGDPCPEGRHVIGLAGGVRVMVATRPVDFRKGAEGLAALVREEMKSDPFYKGRCTCSGRSGPIA